MIPHTIRLRQPWEDVPAMQAGHNAVGRRFNCPTGLDPWERVTLEIDRVMFRGNLALNGTPLGTFQPGELFAADITSLLKPTNELLAQFDPKTTASMPVASSSIYLIDPKEPPSSPIGEVRLIISAVSSSS